MMNKSRKSLLWQLAQSWWILLTFSFLFNGIAFFYIGSKVKNKRWTMFGAIYSFPFIFMIIAAIIDPEFGLIATIAVSSIYVGGLSSTVHAFIIRKEFLIRLEGQQYLKEDRLRQIQSEYALNSNEVHFNKEHSEVHFEVHFEEHFKSPVPKTVYTRGPLIRQS
ncbi:hypothetical protein PMSD_25665 [Paenibacillus macquariensis subsp. defensor]|nr:hypothetical protein PMSD_25665 [Paenibacillus macquariensis subsp. defensor]